MATAYDIMRIDSYMEQESKAFRATIDAIYDIFVKFDADRLNPTTPALSTSGSGPPPKGGSAQLTSRPKGPPQNPTTPLRKMPGRPGKGKPSYAEFTHGNKPPDTPLAQQFKKYGGQYGKAIGIPNEKPGSGDKPTGPLNPKYSNAQRFNLVPKWKAFMIKAIKAYGERAKVPESSFEKLVDNRTHSTREEDSHRLQIRFCRKAFEMSVPLRPPAVLLPHAAEAVMAVIALPPPF